MPVPYETLSSATTGPPRADCCSARPAVGVLLPSGRELAFCRHHYRQHAVALNELIAPHVVAEATSAASGAEPGYAPGRAGAGSPGPADAGTDRTGQAASSRIR